MKNLIYILLICTFSYGQTNPIEIVTKGYYKAMTLDSMISQHSTYYKALESADNYLRHHREVDRAFIEYPEKVELSVKWNDERISINQITETSISGITSTSALIYIPYTDEMSHIYIRFREVGGLWKETDKSLQSVKSPNPLKANTSYEYIVFWIFDNETELRSKLLTFNIL